MDWVRERETLEKKVRGEEGVGDDSEEGKGDRTVVVGD